MPFFDRTTVSADLRLHKFQAGLVTAGTLGVYGTATVAYANVCKWPRQEISGLGHESAAMQRTLITAWRVGETTAPRADMTWVIGGETWNIATVTPRHNHDESAGYAIYDCQCDRKG